MYLHAIWRKLIQLSFFSNGSSIDVGLFLIPILSPILLWELKYSRGAKEVYLFVCLLTGWLKTNSGKLRKIGPRVFGLEKATNMAHFLKFKARKESDDWCKIDKIIF